MIKKVFSIIPFAAIMFIVLGAVSSCKDYNDEIIIENRYDDEQLKKAIEELKAQREQDLIDAQKEHERLENLLKDHIANAEKTYATKAELEDAKKEVEEKCKEMEEKYKAADEALKKELQAKLDSLKTKNEELERQIAAADAKIDKVKKELEDMINKLSQCNCDIEKLNKAVKDLSDLTEKVGTLEENLKNYATKDDLSNYVTQAQLKALKDIVDGLVSCNCGDILAQLPTLADLAALKSQFEADSMRIDALEAAMESVKQDVKCDSLAAALDSIDKAHAKEIEAIKNSMEDLSKEIAENLKAAKAYTDKAIKKLESSITNANNKIKYLSDLLKKVQTDINEELKAMQGDIDALKTAVEKNTDDIAALTGRVDDLEDDVDNLEDALEQRISSVNIQGAYSPVVGYFNMPMGIKSNIIATYYGVFGTGVSEMNFPFAYSESMYNKKENPLNALKASLGYEGETIDALGDNKAGKVYMTINPTDVNLDNVEFSLVNSLGESAPVELEVKPSEDKLSFGYTRAGGVTLYEANATITDTEATDFKLNVSDYKEIFNDLKDGGDIKLSAIPDALYSTFNSFADANAVSASWTDAMGHEHTVLSNYDLAVLSVKPLSYAFMQDFSVENIPVFDRISNAINNAIDKIKVDISFGDFEDVKVNLTKLDLDESKFIISIDTTLTVAGKTVTIFQSGENTGLYFELDGNKYDIVVDSDVNVTVEGSSVNFVYTNNGLVSEILKIEGMVNDQIDQIEGLLDQVNNMLGQLRDTEDKINQSITDAKDKVKTEIQKYLDKFNNKFCAALNSVNSKLQPAMFLKTTDGFGVLSQAKNRPTVISNGAVLVPSSYTAELLAPAFKKYVAITAVDGSTDNLKSANTGDLNKVLDGDVRSVEFNGESGKTYEVTYAALDYAGIVSTVKYYVTVK